MILINLYGAPCAGKSTVRADVFRLLKQRGINCEEVTEFAKKCVWEGRFKTLRNCQPYIFGKQLNDIEMLRDEVDVVITDSPLLLCHYYAKKSENVPASFFQFIADAAGMFDNSNYYIRRAGAYDSRGRVQNEQEAEVVDHELRKMLNGLEINFIDLLGDDDCASRIVDDVMRRLMVAGIKVGDK